MRNVRREKLVVKTSEEPGGVWQRLDKVDSIRYDVHPAPKRLCGGEGVGERGHHNAMLLTPGLTDRSLEKRAIKKTVASEGRQAQSVTASLTEKDCSRKRA